MKYTDPDGRILDTSKVSPEDLEVYKNARTELMKIDRSRKVIMELEASPEIFTIKIDYNNKDEYSPLEKTVYWNPDLTSNTSGTAEFISEITLLFHEIGHAYQDLNGEIPIQCSESQKLKIENANVEQNEKLVADARHEGVRTNYFDWASILKKSGGVWSFNELPWSNVELFKQYVKAKEDEEKAKNGN